MDVRPGLVCLIPLLLTACAWAPGPTLTLPSLSIVGIDYTGETRVREIEPERVDQEAPILKLEVVASDNLYTYFKRRGRYSRTRCFVERDKDDRSYEDMTTGPVQDGIDIGTYVRE